MGMLFSSTYTGSSLFSYARAPFAPCGGGWCDLVRCYASWCESPTCVMTYCTRSPTRGAVAGSRFSSRRASSVCGCKHLRTDR